MKKGSRKGYFFTLDSFIAMNILILCVVLIFSIHSSTPNANPIISMNDDIMASLSSTSNYKMDVDYVRNLIRKGNITDKEATLLEQIEIFHLQGKDSLADDFAYRMISSSIQEDYGFELRIYNATDEYSIIVNPVNKNMSASRQIVNTKRILYGKINDTIWGPMTAEGRMWQ